MTAKTFQAPRPVLDEVEHWFFDDYLPTWVGVAAGTIGRGTDFILDYWSVPLHYSDGTQSGWFLDANAVVAFLEGTQERLKESGYSHTNVPDHRTRVYNDTGAAVEVIWSRCSSDGEIERLAVHFEVTRGTQGWRVVSIQSVPTSASSLGAVWP